MTDPPPDSGLSLTDAAAQLGISERTVLRRIKDGTIAGKKIGEGRGGVWRVYLDSVSDTRTAAVSDSPTDAPGTLSDSQTETAGSVSDSVSDSPTQPALEVLELLRLAEQLRRDNAALVARNEQMAGQLGYLQRQVIEQQETIQRLLMAPMEPVDVTPGNPPVEPEPPAVSERVNWWRRLFS